MSDPRPLLGPVRQVRPPAQRVVDAAARPEQLGPLIASLVRLAGAADISAVARHAVTGAADITGARAAAIGLQRGDAVVLLDSVGYDCEAMAAAAVLPMHAGLPLTECVRTGRTIVRGQAGAAMWIAVPVATETIRGALLVSLTPSSSADAAPLEILADATSAALARLEPAADGVPAGSAVTTPVVQAPGWLAAAAEAQPTPGSELVGSGDVVAVVPGASDDVAWLVVADVCGSGAEAAAVATQFRDTVTVLAAADPAPAALLTGADRALRRQMRADRHVTAAVIRLRRRGGRVQAAIACAGHPPVLRWRRGEVTPIGAATLPLNLLPAESTSYDDDVIVEVEPGDLLLAYTDGLVERGADDCSDLLAEVFARAGALADPSLVVELLHRAMTGTGDTVRDDLALAVVGLT
ncbi:MAG TPA: PP2C family protein-serine/threonine phosphatase [Mycobacteriales bacterium]|nr:PP2C family protein-serine/threonine phosphatase [Mycobacteriales bacterium]